MPSLVVRVDSMTVPPAATSGGGHGVHVVHIKGQVGQPQLVPSLRWLAGGAGVL